MNPICAKVSESGSIELPEEHMKLVGIGRGADVVVWVEEGEIRICALAERIQRIQADFSRLLAGKQASVDDFLALRNEDTGPD